MDDELFIIPSDNVMIGQDDSFILSDGHDLVTESESLVGPPGPPGPAGQDGRDGVDGQSATVTVGTTTTTAPGTDAVVTNVGDNLNAVLNFSLPRGAVGETGPAGRDGRDGSDGSDGFSPIASVEQTEYGADITITDRSGTTTAQVVNGSQGEPGTPGQAATITVGTTTTGNPGTNASVTNSGTSSAAVLEFTIPRGATGDTGPAGQDGRDGVDGSAATIAVGTTTTGNPGTNASVTNSGTSSAAVFNFTIPRGDTGAAGADGNDGAAATIGVGTTTTLPAGSSATVTNSGTSSAAVFNFGIPQGPAGVVYTTLFSGSGTGDVDLNASAANYDYIEIYGTELGGRPLYLKLPTPVLNVKFSYGISFYASGVLYTRTRTYTFTSNTKITSTVDSEQIEIRTSGTTMVASGNITITKVVGIKVS